MAYLAAAVVLLGLLASAGTAVRLVARLLAWGAAGACVYVLLSALRAPTALRAPVNLFTVAAAAALGAPGMGLAIMAHALFR